MEKWLKKNLKYIAILLLALFLIKTVQSCNRKMSLRIVERNLTTNYDSIVLEKNTVIDSLETKIIIKNSIINDLTNELKIAGVRVDEAQKRADAVQRTAEKVKTNTTIEIRGVEKDTSNNEK